MSKRQTVPTPWLDELTILYKDISQMNSRRIWEGVLTVVRSVYRGIPDAAKQINQAILSWPGTTRHRHRYGGTEWRLRRREIGHIHGNWLFDIPFPKKVRDAVVAAGEADSHHILPESGWVSFYLRQPEDIEQAVKLLRRSFELAEAQQARRQAKSENKI
jgi:hypothetical protein